MILTSFVLAIAANCPDTVFVNKTSFPWNDYDTETYLKATKRCGSLYKKSQCVKYFEKGGDYGRDYRVICGNPKK